jgi:acetyl esterase
MRPQRRLLTREVVLPVRRRSRQHPAQHSETRIYRRTGDAQLRLRLWRPEVALGAATVFFPGGGWRNLDLAQFAPQCERLAERGMLAGCAEYRVANRHGTTPLEALDDACAALEHLLGQADDLGFAPERLVAAGGSAGGYLALAAALFGGVQLGALLLFNPVLDTSETGFGTERFGGRGLELSPLHHVRPGLPPTLILQGEADDTTPLATAKRFRDLMQAAGNRCDLEAYPGETHSFFNPERGESWAYRATLSRAEQFFDTLGYLGGTAP